MNEKEKSKGVVYCIWDGYEFEKIKQLLKRSLNSIPSELGTCILTDSEKVNNEFKNQVDHMKFFSLKGHRCQKKCEIFRNSPFDLSVYLDIDTVIMDNIDYGFKMADKYGISICIAPACFAYYATHKEYKLKSELDEDEIQYNCGVIFFNKNYPGIEKVFNDWETYLFEDEFAFSNEQPFLTKSMRDNNFNPCVLPMNYNYRNHLSKCHVYGKIKIWHSTMPAPKKQNVPHQFNKPV